MPAVAPMQTSFNGGELSPLMEGRVDLAKYGTGCAVLENFLPTVLGPAVRRAGTRYISAVKTQSARTWFARFEFSQGEAFVLEFGNLYIRFYTDRGQLESGGSPYEITSPYTTADLTNDDGAFGIQMVQSGDVVYMAHPDHAPRKLSRVANTNWDLEIFRPDDGPFLSLNTDETLVVTASGVDGDVTLTASDDIFESGHVGALFYIEPVNLAEIPPWEPNKKIASNGVSPYGEVRRNDGKVYVCVSTGSTTTDEWRTGNIPPVHDSGIAADGDGNAITSGSTVFAEKAGVEWEYLHSGFGVVRITAVNSATEAEGVVLSRLPDDAVGGGGSASLGSFSGDGTTGPFTITGATSDDPTDYRVSYDITVTDPDGPDYTKTVVIPSSDYTVDGTADEITFDSATTSGATYRVSEYGGTGLNNTFKWAFGAWSAANEWPRAVAFFRERLFWAGQTRLWGSVPGDFESFLEGTPTEVLPDNAINISVLTEKANRVQWLSAADALLVGTAGGELAVGEIATSEPLGPANIAVRDQSGYGSRAIRPLQIGAATLFVQKAGRKLREYQFSIQREGYQGRDLTVLSEHITKGGIIQVAHQSEPESIIWAVTGDGRLIALTYEVEQDVYAWHEHPIGGNGYVESVAVIPSTDGDRDDVYLIVKRTINGATKRYVEWIEEPWDSTGDQEDAFYVDAGATYDGAAATTISGLSHLEGEDVAVLADGFVIDGKTVSGGQITLDTAASVVQVGLPFTSKLQTMRINAGAANGTSQGKTQRIERLATRFLDTWAAQIGADESTLERIQFRDTSDNLDAPVPAFTGDKSIPFPGGYQEQGARVMVVQSLPLPMTVLAVFPQMTTYDR